MESSTCQCYGTGCLSSSNSITLPVLGSELDSNQDNLLWSTQKFDTKFKVQSILCQLQEITVVVSCCWRDTISTVWTSRNFNPQFFVR